MSLKSSTKTDTNVYTLEIEIGAEPFKAAVLKAYNKAKSKIALPGFRKGKAPTTPSGIMFPCNQKRSTT